MREASFYESHHVIAAPPLAIEPHAALRRSGLAAVFVACGFVAGGTLVAKAALAHATPLAILFCQVLASTLAVWTVAVVTGRKPWRVDAWRGALLGLLQPGLSYALAFAGLAIIPASIEGVLLSTETAFVVLLAWPLIRERPCIPAIAAAVIGICGAALMGAEHSGDTAPLIGVALVLGGVVLAAVDTIFTRRFVVNLDPLNMTAMGHVAALAVLGALLPFWPGERLDQVLAGGDLWAIAASGVLIHGAGTVLFNLGLARVSASAAAAVFPSISVLIALGGFGFFHETMNAQQALGAGLVLLTTATLPFVEKWRQTNARHTARAPTRHAHRPD